MARPMTPADVDAVGREAWDATQLEIEGNPPWDELAGDAKQRYFDVVYSVCTYGGASNPFEVKAQEIWVEMQEEEPPAEPETKPSPEEPSNKPAPKPTPTSQKKA